MLLTRRKVINTTAKCPCLRKCGSKVMVGTYGYYRNGLMGCPRCKVRRDQIFSSFSDLREYVLDSRKCFQKRGEIVFKQSPIEILGPYSRHMVEHPICCKKSSDGAQFSFPTKECDIQIKYDHRFLPLVRKHRLKQSHYDLDKDGHLTLTDVIKRNPQN